MTAAVTKTPFPCLISSVSSNEDLSGMYVIKVSMMIYNKRGTTNSGKRNCAYDGEEITLCNLYGGGGMSNERITGVTKTKQGRE